MRRIHQSEWILTSIKLQVQIKPKMNKETFRYIFRLILPLNEFRLDHDWIVWFELKGSISETFRLSFCRSFGGIKLSSAPYGTHFFNSFRRRSLSYRNQCIDLLCKWMEWFLYDRDLHHERVNFSVRWSILSELHFKKMQKKSKFALIISNIGFTSFVIFSNRSSRPEVFC